MAQVHFLFTWFQLFPHIIWNANIIVFGFNVGPKVVFHFTGMAATTSLSLSLFLSLTRRCLSWTCSLTRLCERWILACLCPVAGRVRLFVVRCIATLARFSTFASFVLPLLVNKCILNDIDKWRHACLSFEARSPAIESSRRIQACGPTLERQHVWPTSQMILPTLLADFELWIWRLQWLLA